MANAVVQAEVGKEGKGPAGMTCLVYSVATEIAVHLFAVDAEVPEILVHSAIKQ